MKLIKLMTLAASVACVANAAAQQLPKPDPKPTPKGVQDRFIGGERDYKAYQFVRVPEAKTAQVTENRAGQSLLAGTEMVNTVTGKEAYVSGIVSVLTKDTDVNALAEQFGLEVERLYGRLNLALLRAPEGTDMLQLRREMMDFTGVNNVDVEIVEDIRETHLVKQR